MLKVNMSYFNLSTNVRCGKTKFSLNSCYTVFIIHEHNNVKIIELHLKIEFQFRRKTLYLFFKSKKMSFCQNFTYL